MLQHHAVYYGKMTYAPMKRAPQVVQVLRAHRVRLTRQRRVILDVALQQSGHFSVDAVYMEVARCDPAINLATVYRTLHRLQQIGLLRTLEAGHERLLFEVSGATPHHHLVCTVCGSEQAINAEAVDVLCARLRERYAFLAEPQHLAIPGRCARCQHREATS